MQRWQGFEDGKQDLRYGLRTFRNSPGFSAIVVLTLALAIGANTTIFSIVHAVLLRPLPYKDSAQIVSVWDRDTGVTGSSKRFDAYGDIKAYKERSRSFTELAGAMWAADPQVMAGRGPAKEVFAVPVTANFFSFLGVPAALGRVFRPEDTSAGCAVVLSNSFWQNALNGNRDLIGGSINLNGQNCDVLGVMPQSFAFIPDETDLWTLITSTSSFERDPNRHGIAILGRLKPGVGFQSALSELKILHKQAHLADRHARGSEPQIFPLEEDFTALSGRNLRLSLMVLFAAVVAVLLIACVNVANLLLGRSLRRAKELGIRAALGSSRLRLVRQLLTENLLLSMLAAGIGTGLAVGAVRAFRALNPVILPPGKPVEVNSPVLLFTAALSILTTLIFGFLPAWKGSQTDLNDVLKSTGRGTTGSLSKQRIGRMLVVLEVTLSLVLLVVAGLLIRSVVQFTSAPMGFASEGMSTMTLSLSPVSYSTPVKRTSFYDRVKERLAELPEVRGSTLSSAVPSVGGSLNGVLSIDGRPEPEYSTSHAGEQFVALGYFHFFQIPLVSGREFASSDRPESQAVAVVNEALVREYFPSQDPIGKRLRFRGLPKTESLLIVGVVRDEKHFNRVNEMSWVASPLIYRPLQQDPPAQVHVIVRGTGDGNATGALVQRQLAALDPAVPVFYMETLQHFMSQFTAYPQFRAVLLGGFAGLALLLAVVGLYGVLSQLVEQRTQEIGVRVALGAQRSDVLTLVIRRGMILTGIGISSGLFLAIVVTRFLSSLLYGVGSTDLLTFGSVSLVLTAAAFAAMYLPARRAAKVDPVKALKSE